MLHLPSGLLERRTRFALGKGRSLAVRQQRLVHMADPHLAAPRTEFTTEGFTDDLEVEAALDGGVTNSGVARHRNLAAGTSPGCTPGRRVRHGVAALPYPHVRVGMAARLTADVLDRHEESRIGQRVRLSLKPGRTVTVDKTVALHTSRDPAISDPLDAAIDRVGTAPPSTNSSKGT